MRSVGINNLNYRDNIARKNRRRFFLKLFAIFSVILAAFIGSVYLLFFSTVLKITNTSVTGLKTVDSAEILSLVDSLENINIFGNIPIKPQFNIIFFDSDYLREKVLAKFKVIEDIEVQKEYPHKIVVNITERTAEGTWCYVDDCRYFDRNGATWGKAIRSSGSLLTSIDDFRQNNESEDNIDQSILKPIQEVITGLDKINVKIKRIEIPDNLLGDFKVYTVSGYYLMFNNETNIPDQIKILKILLDEKSADFNPEYIDLRIEGRIYYK